MNKHLEQFMRGLTRKQAAWLLGIERQTFEKWLLSGQPKTKLGQQALTFFVSMSKETQEQMKDVARKCNPNKGGKVY